MLRVLDNGYELDDDRGRVDADIVHELLDATGWANGRPFADTVTILESSARVAALYHRPPGEYARGASGDLVGFARAVSDRVTLAYLCDVIVAAEHRGRGLGLELSRFTVDGDPGLARLKWMLDTDDAHGLYAKLGFQPASNRLMVRPRRQP